MIEIAALATGVGLLLTTKGKKEETKRDLTIDEDKSMQEEDQADSTNDPRQGEMYFGQKMDNGNYDPFYDYSNDPIYNTPYAIQGLEMAQETYSRAYRARIVAPFLVKKDVFFSDKYENKGFFPQQLEIDAWEHPVPALPFVRGSYSTLEMVVEVFNPFDFAVPLQKMRIGNMSLGGKKIYPIPGLRNGGAYFNATGSNPYYFRNIMASPQALSTYWANYLLRCELQHKEDWTIENDDAHHRKNMSQKAFFAPTDFEIDLFEDSIMIGQNMAYYGNLVKQKKGLAAQLSVVEGLLPYYKAEIDGNYIKGGDFKPINASAGVKTNTSTISKKITIAPRSSVLIQVRIPVATIKEEQNYYGFDRIYHGRGEGDGLKDNMSAIIDKNVDDDETWKFNSQEQKHNCYEKSGLSKDDLYRLRGIYGLDIEGRKCGGFLFIDIDKIGDIKESDLRMTCSFYSDASQSVIQNHRSKNQARINNTKVFDLGAYRGGRPSKGEYEWEKTYWENYKYYGSISEADQDLGGDGNLPVHYFWNFDY